MRTFFTLLLLGACSVAFADDAKPNKIERGAQKVEKGVERTAKRTGNAIERGGKATERVVTRTADPTEKKVKKVLE